MRLIVIIIVMFPVLVFAQDGFDGVPLGFGSSGIQSNVGSSSGALSVSIPLEDAIFPIALNYTASGIKVNQRPGIVGLGWNITTEFYVEREVRGHPDESTQGYCGPNRRGNVLANDFTGTSAFNIGEGNWDTEPDIFRFQAPGISGSFLLDPGKNIVKLSHDNFKINFFLSNNRFTSFEITDTQGNVYTFNRRETKTQTILTNGINSTSSSYDARWYLTSINRYNDSNNITFSYTTSYKSENFSYGTSRVSENNPPTISTTWYSTTVSWDQSYLTQVSFHDYRYSFVYHLVNNVRVLRNIDCKYQGNSQPAYATYWFNYGSFLGNNRTKLVNVELRKNGERLTLASFNYYGETGGEPNLPHYYSAQQDHWGYYNNNPHNNLFVYQGADRSSSFSRTRANTLKSVYYSSGGYEEYIYQLNSNGGGLRIREIKTNDGVSTSTRTFSYSLSQIFGSPVYSKRTLLYNPNTYYSIYTTESFRPLFDLYGRSISYSQITETLPDGSRIIYRYNNYSDEYQDSVNNPKPKHPERRRIRYTNAQSLVSNEPLSSNNEIPFGLPNIYGNLTGLLKELEVRNINNQLVRREIYDYDEFNSNEYLYGLARTKTAVIISGFNFNKEFYAGRYFINPRYYRLLKTQTITYNPTNSSQNKKAIVDYQYHPDLLLPTRVESYLDGHYADRRVVQTVYKIDEYRDCFDDNCISRCHQTYDPAVCPTGNQSCINSVEAQRQGCIQGCNTPPVACLESKGLALNFIEHNLIELTSSTRELKGTTVLGKTTNSYQRNSNNNVELSSVKTYIGTDQLVSDLRYTYNSNGKLIRTIDDVTGNSKAFILNSEGKILAEADNVNTDQIYYNGFEYSGGSRIRANPSECKAGYHYFLGNYTVSFTPPSGTNYVISYWYRQNNQWKFNSRSYTGIYTVLTEGDAIDEIRIHPVGTTMKTYTYDFYNGKPLSEADANNVTTHTEYDSFNRVKLIRDSDFNILKSYEYNIVR